MELTTVEIPRTGAREKAAEYRAAAKSSSDPRERREFEEIARAYRIAARDDKGIVLRGGGADEAPGAYKRLPEVLQYHDRSVRILHTLTPLGVAMAGPDTFDPYKD